MSDTRIQQLNAELSDIDYLLKLKDNQMEQLNTEIQELKDKREGLQALVDLYKEREL